MATKVNLMKIIYYEEEDMLFIEFQKGKVVRDESLNWNVNIAYTNDGIGEITILDAQKNGLYPLQIEKVLSGVAWKFYELRQYKGFINQAVVRFNRCNVIGMAFTGKKVDLFWLNLISVIWEQLQLIQLKMLPIWLSLF